MGVPNLALAAASLARFKDVGLGAAVTRGLAWCPTSV